MRVDPDAAEKVRNHLHSWSQRTFWPAGQPPWAEGYLAGKPLVDEQPLATLYEHALPVDAPGAWTRSAIEGAVEWLIVVPLTFGRARLAVCEPGAAGNASLEHWCLDTPTEAIAAWLGWPTVPARWNRHQRRDGVLEWPDGRTEPVATVIGKATHESSREISEISEAADA